MAVTGQAAPEQVQCLVVTEGTLNALGVGPLLGRWFTAEDDKPTAPETAILTYGYWQRKFGGNPAAVGSQLIVDGKLTAITGVMPQSFRFLDEKAELILPMRFDRAKLHLGNFSYRGIARLKPGVTLAQANADVARMIPMVNRKFTPPPGFSVKLFEEAGIQADVRPLKDDIVGDLGKVLWVLDGEHRSGAADRVRQRRQPSAGEGGRTPTGTGHSYGSGRRDRAGLPRRYSPRACCSACWAGLWGSGLRTSPCVSWWRSRPLIFRAWRTSRWIRW